MKFVLENNILIESGKFATIFRATLNSESVAAKKNIDHDQLEAEARFLMLCDHPNVLKYRGMMEFKDEKYLITEFAQGGNLQQRLGLSAFSPDSENIVISGFSRAEEFVEGIPLRRRIEEVPDTEYTFKSDIYLLALVVFQIFEDRRNVNRKTLGEDIQIEAHHRGGLNRRVFGKEIWEQTILDSLLWRAKRRPTAIQFYDAFRE